MYTVGKLAEVTCGKLIGDSSFEINYLLTDSRALSLPEETIFVALKSDRNDGAKYIPYLYKNKVRCFLVNEYTDEMKTLSNANFIVVKDTLKALQDIATMHRAKYSIPIIGITGSNGKTVVKEWLYQLLHSDYRITRSPRSYNSQIGVPLSVWELNEETQLGIFEVGISYPNEMTKLSSVVSPSIGVFTNLGDAHQENFNSLKEKCIEKLKLFANCKTIIYCKDDKLVDITIAQICKGSKLLSIGHMDGADIRVVDILSEGGNSKICLNYKDKEVEYSIPFSDTASIDNSLRCFAVMVELGVDVNTITQRMSGLETVAMRLEVKEGLNGSIIIDDSYNSDLSSLGIAIDFLQRQAQAKKMKRTLVLSDMMQIDVNTNTLYSDIATLVRSKGVERFIGIGPTIKAQAFHFSDMNATFYDSTESFLQHLNPLDYAEEAILLKGSRAFHFEEISDSLAKIVHETVLEVDLSALVNNFNYFRSFLSPGSKIMSMVKANAYGSGDIEVARTLQQNGCDYLAVAVADEGVALRKEGIHIPIVVMNPELNSFQKIFEFNLEPEVYSFTLLEKMISEACRQGIVDYPIHVKIDTGMHRLGFEPKDVDKLIEVIKTQKSVRIRSVFSHLVGSDDAAFDSFTLQQINTFSEVKERISKAFKHKILAHILNSAGIERFSQYQFDMVRLGIGHYGMSATGHTLEEVCTLKTNILQIRKVSASDTIGYSRKGTLSRDSIIGAIPIGYADGLNRKLGNRNGAVLVNGVLAPIVGNICMDVCMIDLTDVPNVKEGDTVIIFGKGNPIQGIADKLGTISYEVLANISTRVKRIYFRE